MTDENKKTVDIDNLFFLLQYAQGIIFRLISDKDDLEIKSDYEWFKIQLNHAHNRKMNKND